MDVVVDPSVRRPSPGGSDWRVTLALSPGTGSGRLDWHPQGLADPETIMITLGRFPLTSRQVREVRTAVADFPDITVIDRAVWTYLHGQGRWGYAPAGTDDLFGAVEELTALAQQAVE
ncbi:hypothetical protein ACFV9E_03400 [Streptomyces sp. NPDC059835]|uniref:hypothetical protein n=1 Tax=Streptomyces sp. NPDC059835 TaxID=3346967 RepID=UPI00365C48D9